MERDPVCGMEIKNTIKAERIEYKGKAYYFCSTLCKIQFEQEPGKYAEIDDENSDSHHVKPH